MRSSGLNNKLQVHYKIMFKHVIFWWGFFFLEDGMWWMKSTFYNKTLKSTLFLSVAVGSASGRMERAEPVVSADDRSRTGGEQHNWWLPASSNQVRVGCWSLSMSRLHQSHRENQNYSHSSLKILLWEWSWYNWSLCINLILFFFLFFYSSGSDAFRNTSNSVGFSNFKL